MSEEAPQPAENISERMRKKFKVLFVYLNKEEAINSTMVFDQGVPFPKAEGIEENEFLLNLLHEAQFTHMGDAYESLPSKLDLSVYSQNEVTDLANRINHIGFWSGLIRNHAIDFSGMNNDQKISFVRDLVENFILKHEFNAKKIAELTPEEKIKLRYSYITNVAHGSGNIWMSIFNNLNTDQLSFNELIELADNSHSSEIWRLVTKKLYEKNTSVLATESQRDTFLSRAMKSILGEVYDPSKYYRHSMEECGSYFEFMMDSYLKQQEELESTK